MLSFCWLIVVACASITHSDHQRAVFPKFKLALAEFYLQVREKWNVAFYLGGILHYENAQCEIKTVKYIFLNTDYMHKYICLPFWRGTEVDENMFISLNNMLHL